MNQIEPFQEGSEITSMSAEAMNAKIVRPLNSMLAMIATPPLKLVKTASGFLLYDTTAVDPTKPYGKVEPQAPPEYLNVNGDVTAIAALPLGGYLLAGRFTQVGGVIRNHMVKATFGTAYAIDLAFDPLNGFWQSVTEGEETVYYMDSTVRGFVMSGDLPIWYGRVFSYQDVEGIGTFRRLDLTGLVDPTYPPIPPGVTDSSPFIWKSVKQPDGKIIIAGFVGWWGDDTNGQAVEGLFRLNEDGTIDTTFTAEFEGYIRAPFDTYSPTPIDCLIQPDGKIVICGTAFRTDPLAVPLEFNGIARFNADGSKDTSWNLQPGNHKYTAIALQSDGKIIAAGTNDFDTGYESAPAGGFVRYNTDGTIDATFQQTDFHESNLAVYALAIDATGKTIAAGVFAMPFTGYHFAGIILDTDGELIEPLGGWTNGAMHETGKGLCLAFEGTDILMGGDFPLFTYAPVNQPYFARFDSAGNHKPITA